MSSGTDNPKRQEGTGVESRGHHGSLIRSTFDDAPVASLLLDDSLEGVGGWEVRSGTLELSDSWYRLLGYEPDEIDHASLGWEQLVHPNDVRPIQQLIDEADGGGSSTIEYTCRVRHNDTSWRWHRQLGRVVERDLSGKPAHIVGIDVDITEQHDREVRLLHSAKMTSLATFAGVVAHDFSNVLAIIQGHTEALTLAIAKADIGRGPSSGDDGSVAGSDGASQLQMRADAIARAVTRASSLVRQLADATRPPSGLRSEVDLGDALAKAIRTIDPLVGPDVRVELHLPPEPAVVEIDERLLQAAVTNLATNARDAMPTGGDLTIRLTTAARAGKSVASIEVTDTGSGIDAAALESIFDPLYTTKPRSVATGLGLATTYTIISEAGGTIRAESMPGTGTTITIELPLVAPPPGTSPSTPALRQPTAAAVSDASPTASPVDERVAVCIVEDEAELLELTTDVVRSAGYRVHSALGAAEAIEILESHPGVAVLVTDVVMPGMGGAELATIVRRRWPSIRTLFVSGFAVTAATEFIDPAKLLTKPVGSDELLTAIANELHTTSSESR